MRTGEPRMDPTSLYREDVITDRRVGTLRVMTPIKTDGSTDLGRPVLYVGEAQLLTQAGLLPLVFEIDATSLADASASTRIAWKQQTLSYWAARAVDAGKELWITEMQGEPWPDQDGFTTDSLLESALAYKDQGATVVLLWGVESWLLSPDWMSAGMRAIGVFRFGPGGFEPPSRHLPGSRAAALR